MKKYFLNPIEIILIVILIVSIGIPFAFAVENTFETRLVIGPEDTANPTIPTGLTATPVSSSQINLAWNASTDDIGVAGYRIFRDAVIIASTTSLFYQDLGLTASTTYSYNVEAFDSVPKYSGQSATVNATTSEAVVPPVTPTATTTPSTGGSSGSGSIILNISNLVVVPSQNSSVINFSTNQPTQAKVYWGLTGEYELGSIAGLFYGFTHSIHVDGLLPNTRYFYKVEVVNGLGVTKTVTSSFQTQSDFSESVLTNVINFKAVPAENSITLNWTNPYYDEFESVRVVRSDKFFPRDIYDGQTIYEGADESYIDRDVKVGTTYYYSIFAKDTKGNYSSGALAQARIRPAGEIAVTATSTDPFIDISVLKNVHPVIAELVLADFDFIQDGKKILNIGNTLTINGKKNLTVSLNYNKVPEILKTIAMTMVDPDDSSQVFPFLLRVNKDKTAYEAILAPLGKSGDYKLHVIVLDYKNQGLKRLNGTLQAFVLGSVDTLRTSTGKSFNSFWWILVLVIILIVFYFMSHKRKQNQIAILVLIMSIGGVFAGYSFGVNNTYAAINREINYQGKLTNASNVAVADGTYVMEFKLYTQLTGGAAIWTETLTSTNEVQVTSGLFSVMLGSTTPFTGVNFNQTLYLGVNIEGDGEMSPRKIIGAVPAAFVADTLDNLSSEQFLRSDTQNATSSANTFLNILQSGAGKVAEFFGAASQSVMAILSNGNVGIGVTAPDNKLVVFSDASGADAVGGAISVSRYFTSSADQRSGSMFSVYTGGQESLAFGVSSGSNPATLAKTKLIIQENGNIGIGTTSPVSKLSVLGESAFAGGASVGIGYAGTAAPTGGLIIQGNVGIGTVNPASLLDVNGTINATTFTATGINIGNSRVTAPLFQGTGAWQWADVNSTNIIKLTTNSAERVRIDSVGNVGIGTTSPVSKLSVLGESAFAGGASVGIGYAGTAAPTGGLIIQGNVGIGTTAPNYTLQVSNSTPKIVVHDTSFSGTSGALHGQFGFGYYADSTVLLGGLKLLRATSATNGYNGYATVLSAITDGGSETDVLYVGGNGNVGIGTTAPADLLEVRKDTSAGVGGRLTITNFAAANAANTAELGFKDSSAYTDTFYSSRIVSTNGSDLAFFNYSSPRGGAAGGYENMRITTAGNVGIGTTDPGTYKLAVAGAGSFTARSLINNILIGEIGANYDIIQSQSSAGLRLTTGGTAITLEAAGNEVLRGIGSTGNVGIGTTSPSRLLSVSDDGTYSAYFSGRVGMGTNTPGYPLEVTGTTVSNLFLAGGTTAAGTVGQTYISGNSINGQYGTNANGIMYINYTGYQAGATQFRDTQISDGKAGNILFAQGSTGNVGIGTTSPVSKLSVLGESAFAGGASVGIGYAGTAAPTGGLIIQGNVGIGTTAPPDILSVSALGAGTTGGRITVLNSGAGLNSAAEIGFKNDVAFGAGYYSSRIVSLRTDSPISYGSDLLFYNYDGATDMGLERMRIKGNGNVGIGTTNPTQKLQVNGHCVTGDTLLPIRRRRKKKKGEKGEGEEGEKSFDDKIGSNVGNAVIDEDWEYLMVPIKDVETGDEVLSLNKNNGLVEYRPIKGLMDMGVKDVYELKTKSGRVIRTTSTHPYLVRKSEIRSTKSETKSITQTLTGFTKSVIGYITNSTSGTKISENREILTPQSSEISRETEKIQTEINNKKELPKTEVNENGLLKIPGELPLFSSENKQKNNSNGEQSSENVNIDHISIDNRHSNYDLINNKQIDQNTNESTNPDKTTDQLKLPANNGPINTEAKNICPTSAEMSESLETFESDNVEKLKFIQPNDTSREDILSRKILKNDEKTESILNLRDAQKCPYCESSDFVKRGTRKNKHQTVQLYLCRNIECAKTFTASDVKGKHFPLRVIIEGMSYYNLGLNLVETCQILKKKFDINPGTSTLSDWINQYKPLCTFGRLREYAIKMFSPKNMVEVVTMAHRQLYRFRYHRAKTVLMLEEFRNRSLKPLKEYLDAVSSETPHQYFADGERMSEVKSKFDKTDMIVKGKFNYANKLAAFVLQTVKDNKQRHEELQRFMIANDSCTVATEVPVYIRREDVEHMENVLKFSVVGRPSAEIDGSVEPSIIIKGSNKPIPFPKLLTGHIDFVQIRNGQIHLLDYKPNAAKEKPIEQLTWYALAMSRLTGLRIFNFTCAWFDEKDYFEFYPLHVVKKLQPTKKKRRVYYRSGEIAEVPKENKLTIISKEKIITANAPP